MKNLFFIEVTDVYGGEANYSWVTRHVRRSGLNWRNDGYRYLSKSGATCAFVDQYDETSHGQLRLDTDERPRQLSLNFN